MSLFIVAVVSCFFQTNSLTSQMPSCPEDPPIFAAGHCMRIAPCHPHSTRQSIIMAHPSFSVCEPQDQLAVRVLKCLEVVSKLPIALLTWVLCMLERCWKFPNLLETFDSLDVYLFISLLSYLLSTL